MFSLIDTLKNESGQVNIELIDRVCFLIDVKKQLFESYYDSNFKSGNGIPLSTDQLEFLCLYLRDNYPSAGCKVLNTLLKIESGILKNMPVNFVFPSEVCEFLETQLSELQLPSIKNNLNLVEIGDWVNLTKRKDKLLDDVPDFKQIDILLVKWNETLGSAYSYSFIKNKLRPLSVITAKPKQGWKGKVLNILPVFTRKLLYKILRKSINEKPLNSCIDVFDQSYQLHEIFNSKIVFKNNKVVRAININDPKIINAMSNAFGSALLFSGGGIVRQKTFDSISKKFIHVHPGLLPSVRGADCFFWSVLLDGFPSCTAMYQNAGIDTGEIIHEERFKLPKFNQGYIEKLNIQSPENLYEIIYRSILDYYDPVMRAMTFEGVLKKIKETQIVDDLEVRKQVQNEGRNYHFMHERLRNRLIELLIK